MMIDTPDPGPGSVGQPVHILWFRQLQYKVSTQATGANLLGLLGAVFSLACLLGIHDTNNWNIRLPLYLIVVVWTILRPITALYLLPIAIPWGSLDPINLGGLSLNSADILVFLLAIGWLMSFTLRPYIKQGSMAGPLDRTGFTIPRYLASALIFLLFTMILSTTVTTSITLSLKEIVKWLEVVIVVFVGSQYIRTPRQLWTILTIMFLAAISQAAMGYIQYFFNIGPQSFIRDASLRVYGTFGQPNPYAGYINMTLLVAIALMLLAGNWKTCILAALTTLALAPLVVPPIWFTQSKGGIVAFTAAIIALIVLGFPRLRKLMASAGVLVLCVGAAYLAGLIPDRYIAPVMRLVGLTNISFTTPNPQDFATAERIAHWIAGIRMFETHPFLGVGIGNYPAAYHLYYLTIFVNDLGHAHDYYINIAAEAGLVGLTALLLFLLAMFVAGGRSFRTISKLRLQLKERRPAAGTSSLTAAKTTELLRTLTTYRALAVGLLAALLTVCVHNLVDNLYVHSMTNLFALLLILLIRLEDITRNAVRQNREQAE